MYKYILPDILIRAGSSKGTDGVFSTTFHELAHASHFKKVGSGYWIKYINYIITYGAYGDGHGANSGNCGIGEMWGNYFSAFLIRQEFKYTTPFHNDWFWFNEEEDWYNPGFLKFVDNISDVSISEIFGCLKSTTNTFSDLKNGLKLKTVNDEKVDQAFANYSDWP